MSQPKIEDQGHQMDSALTFTRVGIASFDMKCSISFCQEESYCRSWCRKHYTRWRFHANPLHLSLREQGTGSIKRYGKRGKYAQFLITVDSPYRGHCVVAEHIHLMEMKIGRRILRSEVVHHKNENPLDNAVENLELMTRSEHMKHHGSLPKPNQVRGERQGHAVLTEALVREIRKRRAAGEMPTAISRSMGYKLGTIRSLLNGKTWKHVP